jgi:hypothetical protein
MFYYSNIGKGFIIQKYDRSYMLSTRITEPDGSVNEDSYTMDELPGNYSETYEITGDRMGEYSAEVTLENLMVKPGSKYRTIQSDSGEITQYVNKPPLLTEVKVLTSKVRVNQEMELSCKALDQDSNGGLRTFLISWGEIDDDGFDVIQEVNVTSNPASIRVKHIYRETGSFTITVSIVDNGPQGDPLHDPPIEDHVRLATKMIEIIVRLI